MKPIALVLATYMLIGSLFPRTDFSQLLKLANVADHFRIHENLALAEGQTFSQWQFLKSHFLAPDDHQHGMDSSHCQLPLHSVSHSNVLSSHSVSHLFFSRPVVQIGKVIFHYIQSEAIHSPGGIFHPPVAG